MGLIMKDLVLKVIDENIYYYEQMINNLNEFQARDALILADLRACLRCLRGTRADIIDAVKLVEWEE